MSKVVVVADKVKRVLEVLKAVNSTQSYGDKDKVDRGIDIVGTVVTATVFIAGLFGKR
jgi:hypothetical protein